MPAAGVALPQAREAELVRRVEDVQAVRGAGRLEPAASKMLRIQRRLVTVFAGQSSTTDRPLRSSSTTCGPMAARSRTTTRP
jgi:hypothetical protein